MIKRAILPDNAQHLFLHSKTGRDMMYRMNNKKFSYLIGAVVVVAFGVILFNSPESANPETANVADQVAGENRATEIPTVTPKEFALDSFYETKDGKTTAGFSVNRIEVKKGDTVQLKVTNIKGMHDFVIDELNVRAETPEGKETIVAFTADKVGEFKYYCSKFNHRQIGQEGTLVVTE
jgi:heme/copper-type cytochrome/quinol oxidase subunit 2